MLFLMATGEFRGHVLALNGADSTVRVWSSLVWVIYHLPRPHLLIFMSFFKLISELDFPSVR